MQFTIPGYANPTIVQLKEFCSNNGIVPTGNKTIKRNWIDAIDTWSELQQEAIALAKDAENEAQEIATSIEVAVVSIGSLVVAALTSEAAIVVYRTILKTAVLAVVMMFMLTQSALKWLWANKHHAAVYHWVADWLSSPIGKNAITHALIAEWVITQWVEAVGSRLDSIAQLWHDASALALARAGLAGVAIEV